MMLCSSSDLFEEGLCNAVISVRLPVSVAVKDVHMLLVDSSVRDQKQGYLKLPWLQPSCVGESSLYVNSNMLLEAASSC